MTSTAEASKKTSGKSPLNTRFFSHATLECKDIACTRKFFEEFLGFETVLMAPVAFWARMGGDQIIVVVKMPQDKKDKMPLLNHNGLDVNSDQDVDAAYEIVRRDAEKWGLHRISRPSTQHGTYSFYFWDRDDNCWEILSNPPGGYTWAFQMGDQQGAGHTSKAFVRPQTESAKG